MFLSAFALEYMYQFTITSYGGLRKIAETVVWAILLVHNFSTL